MPLSPRLHSKCDLCFLLSLLDAIHVGFDCCGGNQGLTPSVPVTLRLYLSLTLRFRVNFWVLVASCGEGADLTRQDPWAIETWEVCVVFWTH